MWINTVFGKLCCFRALTLITLIEQSHTLIECQVQPSLSDFIHRNTLLAALVAHSSRYI